ncbi:hypothetical protein BAE44_0016833 [Dichanthelium oligosanthes]|uniref:RING-type E3 ubiquitin transferase n=1 Tax=Dichanthelium oligosanthes TaxID=888268 RepID=A0A1E5VAI7_9POAL|nr:hypothetical protein BAE44_0016833 [Dichanthelium oligosanthes]
MGSPGKKGSAMGSLGKKGSSLIRRRVEAATTCTCLNTAPQPEPSGGEAEFVVQLKCDVTQYISAGRARAQTRVRAYRGGGAEASFIAAGPEDVPVDEDGVRHVMRQLLRTIRPLRDLELTDDEWESILPEDVVPKLADLARGHDGSRAAAVELEVNQYVRYSAPRVLITACKAAPEGKDGECSICFDALREEAAGKGALPAVELPGCAHAFHRRCISKWFGKKPTWPLCRGNVTKHLDPELQKHLAKFSYDDPDPPAVLDDSPGNVAASPCESCDP